MAKGKKRQSENHGRIAEWVALGFLLLKGYRPLFHRMQLPTGEIDWIFVRGTSLLFVEVKFRRDHKRAKQAITISQQKRLVASMQHFMALMADRYPEKKARFDLVTVNRFFLPVHHKDILRA